ncbi:MAG: shikimate kinase [Candidatus Nanopelagicales bacterium]
MSPVCVLVGAPGAGKSKVGRTLAAELGVPMRDTDRDIELSTGRTIAEIFTTDGEERFRALECEAVQAALAEHDGVLALGGGAVLAESTRALLADQRVVWLRVGLAVAARRTGLSGARPLLVGNVRGRLAVLLAERTALYQEVAKLTVEADSDDLAGKVSQIRKWLIDAGPLAGGAPQ